MIASHAAAPGDCDVRVVLAEPFFPPEAVSLSGDILRIAHESHAILPDTEAEYERQVALLDELVDGVGNDESRPPASLMEVIGLLIEKYEDKDVPELESSCLLHEDPPKMGE